MSDKQQNKQPAHPQHQQEEQERETSLHTLHINGHCPSQREAVRIFTAPAIPVDKDDIATRPLHSTVRGFQLLR